MRRLVACTVLAFAAMAGPAAAGDSAAGIATVGAGCGTTSCVKIITAFDIRSWASGANPYGPLSQYLDASIDPGPRLGIEGQVTCLRVAGRRASIGFIANAVPGGANIPSTAYETYVVEDNGSSGDRATTLPSFRPVTTCPDPTGVLLQPISSGDVRVHDALTLVQARTACSAEPAGEARQRCIALRHA